MRRHQQHSWVADLQTTACCLLLTSTVIFTAAGEPAAAAANQQRVYKHRNAAVHHLGAVKVRATGDGAEGDTTDPMMSPYLNSIPFASKPANPSHACEPPVYESPVPQGVPIPPLSAGQKPNFIVILTDDQGWDDIGLHNPGYVNTPNLDRFIRSATLFDNFYTSPQCSPSRAMILTGRDYARTGTLLVNAGWDTINTEETTIGEFMSAADYSTAQFGKWHNGEEMGYEPWNTGFKETWMAPMALVAHINPILSHNGVYVQTRGLLEDVMADKLTSYLDQQATGRKPFFVYYATRSIHVGKLEYPTKGTDGIGVPGEPGEGEGSSRSRPVPPTYKAKYYNNPKYAGISNSTIDAWAMLEYLDDALGKIFDYLEKSPLRNNTYVMIGGDNGSALLDALERKNRQTRMPSKMMGQKSFVQEGGIRNWWAAQGPGVEAGVIDSTLLQLTDIMPTVAELAGVAANSVDHMPWDGISFANLLRPATSPAGSADTNNSSGPNSAGAQGQAMEYRGAHLATTEQQDRFVFSLLAPQCWDFDAIPELDADRQVIKPQTLLDYDNGGKPQAIYRNQLRAWLDVDRLASPGFKACVAVRWREYKWLGLTNKVYRLTNGSHVELPCNEVPQPEAGDIAQYLSTAARAWWQSVVAESHSFTKTPSYLGLPGQQVTNMLTTGAKERTAGTIRVVQNGVTGFSRAGDRICMNVKVLRSGSYEAVFFYTSLSDATMKLSIGPYDDISSGAATSVTVILPMQKVLKGMSIGMVNLSKSASDTDEACLELVADTPNSSPIFKLLSNIQFIWSGQKQAGAQSIHGDSTPSKATPSSHSMHPLSQVNSDNTTVKQITYGPVALDHMEHARLPARSEVLQGQLQHSAVKVAVPAAGLAGAPGVADWTALRHKYGWPDGQQVMESMYAPGATEEIDGCDACHQPI